MLDTQHDATTNEMVTPLRATAICERRMVWRSLSARQFLGLTPVETQHGGHSQLYLWLSVGTTELNQQPHDTSAAPVSLRVQADAQTYFYPLLVWHREQQPRALANPLPVPMTHSLRTALSERDFAAIATAEDVTLALISATGEEEVFSVSRDRRNDWAGIAKDSLPRFSVEVRHQ